MGGRTDLILGCIKATCQPQMARPSLSMRDYACMLNPALPYTRTPLDVAMRRCMVWCGRAYEGVSRQKTALGASAESQGIQSKLGAV